MNKKQIKETEKWIERRIERAKQDIERAKQDIERAKQDIKNLRKSKKMLDKDKCHFRINLTSLWAAEGEKSLRYDAPVGESLTQAAKSADQEFMRLNHRSDVQADRSAWLCIDAGEDKNGMPIGERIYFEHPMEAKRRRERRKIQLEKSTAIVS